MIKRFHLMVLIIGVLAGGVFALAAALPIAGKKRFADSVSTLNAERSDARIKAEDRLLARWYDMTPQERAGARP